MQAVFTRLSQMGGNATVLNHIWQDYGCNDGLRPQTRALIWHLEYVSKAFIMGRQPDLLQLSNGPSKPRFLRRREIVIRIKEDKKSDLPPGKPITTPEKQEYLTSLRRNFESKSTPQVNVVSRPILPKSASSSISSKGGAGISNANPSSNGTVVVLEESQNKYAILPPRSASVSSLLLSHSNVASIIELLWLTISRSWLSARKAKFKKTVRMDLPVELPSRPPPATQIPVAPVALTVIVQAIPTPVPAPAPQPPIAIKDLCSTLSATGPYIECLGYLCDDLQRHHELRPVKEHQPTSTVEIVSLETLLTGPEKLSRHDRYKIASILASSLLQLQSTPWLADKIEKKSIFFYRRGTKVLIEHPYVHQEFSSVKASAHCPHTTQSRFAARNSLSHLGILLLELCFGQTIENQDMWKSYLGADGKPHQGTDYMTARDWAEMVCEEEPAFEHIIKCCVFCVFEEKADWENKKFIQAVYASVVAPLEKIISKWPIS
jgi:hypothetical protein